MENEASFPPIKKGRADIEQRCSETKEMSSVAETSEAFTCYPDKPINDYHSFQECFDRSYYRLIEISFAAKCP